ncbi:MAG: DNA recombination/repair protein RecA, partial [Bradyrhizobium sp.]|nr:DNA recombination/repair protein RecA [Bradyrhizobium sp.]
DMSAKIETSIRQNSGLIAEQVLAADREDDADGEEPADE